MLKYTPFVLQMDLANNITVLWDGEKIGIDIPESLRGVFPHYHVFGLLGAYNNNTEDDFTGPDGVVRNSTKEFGESWVVPGSCPPERNHTTCKKPDFYFARAHMYNPSWMRYVFRCVLACLEEGVSVRPSIRHTQVESLRNEISKLKLNKIALAT